MRVWMVLKAGTAGSARPISLNGSVSHSETARRFGATARIGSPPGGGSLEAPFIAVFKDSRNGMAQLVGSPKQASTQLSSALGREAGQQLDSTGVAAIEFARRSSPQCCGARSEELGRMTGARSVYRLVIRLISENHYCSMTWSFAGEGVDGSGAAGGIVA